MRGIALPRLPPTSIEGWYDALMVKKKRFSIESAFGSVRPTNRPEDFKALSRLARDEKARAELTHDRDFDRVPQVKREEP